MPRRKGAERQSLQPGSVWTAYVYVLRSVLRSSRAARGGHRHDPGAGKSLGGQLGHGQDAAQFEPAGQYSAAGGITRATGPLANLAKAGTTSALDGQGATTRDTTLTATISTVVTQVLPNGSLVIQGTKNVKINSENQVLALRGIVRPVDLSAANMVSSDRVAQMDLQVNGKGVVGDSVKRPFILYRLLMDILP